MIFKRRRRPESDAGVTIGQLVERLEELDEEATIFAREPWTATSPAILHVQDLDAEEDLLRIDDHKYLLEVDIARDVVEVCETWRRDEGLDTSLANRIEAVIHYATHDAYLPVHPQPPLPVATVSGFTLQVLWFDKGDRRGHATLTAPDGARAQLVWDSGPARFEHRAVHSRSSGSWGLYGVARPLPLTTDDEATAYLQALYDDVESAWQRWREAAST